MEEEKDKEKKEEIFTQKNIIKVAVALFCTLSAVIVCFFLLYRFTSIKQYASEIVASLSSIVAGFVIAYILNPLMKTLEAWFVSLSGGEQKLTKKKQKFFRAAAIFLSECVMIVILTLLVVMIAPELVRNAISTINQLIVQLQALPGWIEELQTSGLVDNPYLEPVISEAVTSVTTWLSTDLLGTINVASQYLMKSAIGVVNFLFDFVIGIIVSVYVLASKEHFCGISKKILYSLVKPAVGNEVLEVMRQTDHIFGGFIMGKILDSAIIGVICYIGLLILRMPYAMVVSVVIGVTNVIPFFGPFIGAVPCTLLIMLNNPIKGLIFVVFILVLQQIDGNIIGPKILGDSTGLNSFWIIFAILFAGGMFGIVGMMIGAPSFAVIYYLVRKRVDRHLKKKSLPLESSAYVAMKCVDPKTGKPVYDETD